MIPRTNLVVDQDKVHMVMARNCMNAYDLCSKANISYNGLYRILKYGRCKIATLGRIAAALNVDVTEIIQIK